MRINGAQAILQSLVNEGVETVFGIPGGVMLSLYHALPDYPIHHVLTRHEQGAAHAADGYARASGRVGVCFATSGPGASNLVTGLATALADSSPVVAITGQVQNEMLGKDGFQEASITAMTLTVTKHNFLVTKAKEIPQTLKDAFHIARTGRPGPVHVDITKDAMVNLIQFRYPESVNLPGYKVEMPPDTRQMERAFELLVKSKKPIVLAGRGVVLGNAEDELLEFAEQANIPVVTSLLGIGSMPEDHPLCLGHAGMHGKSHTNLLLNEADLIISFGCRFSDRIVGKSGTFGQNAKIIQVDLDPVQLNKLVKVDVAIKGNVKEIIPALLRNSSKAGIEAWFKTISELVGESDRENDLLRNTDKLMPQYVIHELSEATDGSALLVTDVGQNQQWASQFYSFKTGKRNHITSGGMGTMGFALPAAVGASMALPDKETWVIAGDGGFQMTMMELATVVQEKLPLKIAILNNGYLGMVRQWQEMFFENRYSGVEPHGPDFTQLAMAYGIDSMKVRERGDVKSAIRKACNANGPFLLEFMIERGANVFPMIAPGAAPYKMIRSNTKQS